MAPSPSPIVVDARGHRCPTPTLRLRRALEPLAYGARVELWADDPLARIDVPHFLAETGDRLIATRDEGRATVFTIERRSPAAPPVPE
jgi:tRNA 2-thiouridine synthesizing protein A